MTDKHDNNTWNEAIEAAAKAIVEAPIFPRDRAALNDGERLGILMICNRKILELKR